MRIALTIPKKKYYVYLCSIPKKDLEDVADMLRTSRDIRIKKYFKDGELQEKTLRCKFENITIEDAILRGRTKFETAENSIDLDGNYDAILKVHKLDFFVSFKPKHHLIIVGESSIARQFARIISKIFYNGDTTQTHRLKLTDEQIIKFLDSNRFILKGEYRSTIMQGVSTMGIWGSNIAKPIEMELINKYLAEHKAIKPLLLDYNWTIWISKKTGVLCCLDSHNPVDFVEFIQKKILPLSV